MKAIIFAAGLGTRLKPLTDNCPKALVLLNGKPLLWHSISLLKKYGIDDITVNVHHFSKDIIKYLSENEFNIRINISDESDLLLDTGGGLLKARHFLDGNEPFIACNVDIISSVDIGKLVEYHKENHAIATLVVKNRLTSRYFMFDDSMKLTGWANTTTGEEIISNEEFYNSQMFAFSGIQVLSPEIFDLIEEKGKFSITALYLRLAEKHTIKGWIDESEFWLDLGKPGQIEIAEKYLMGL
ncbi:MAG: NTP transferase domain-containing protein [Prolixibacteraceae bacterium]|nr:NTP transferase domain-containing protein [Prolixibacteraceae bacterium]